MRVWPKGCAKTLRGILQENKQENEAKALPSELNEFIVVSFCDDKELMTESEEAMESAAQKILKTLETKAERDDESSKALLTRVRHEVSRSRKSQLSYIRFVLMMCRKAAAQNCQFEEVAA